MTPEREATIRALAEMESKARDDIARDNMTNIYPMKPEELASFRADCAVRYARWQEIRDSLDAAMEPK